MRGESVRVSTIAATAITAALIPMQSAHSRTTFRSRTTTCAGRRPVSREVQVQSTIEPTRQRSHSEVFATGVWTHESMRVPTWHLQETNSCHGLPAGCGHRLPSAMDGAWLNLGPTLVKVLVLPAEDPHYFTLAVPGSHRAGPYDPGGAPYKEVPTKKKRKKSRSRKIDLHPIEKSFFSRRRVPRARRCRAAAQLCRDAAIFSHFGSYLS